MFRSLNQIELFIDTHCQSLNKPGRNNKEDITLSYDLKEVCKDIRCDIMTCIGHLGVGHIGGCLSVVEALAVLYFKEMNIDP